MDVVATEIKRLGGALHMETKAGEGTRFTIRLPFTLAISHALVVRTGEEYYALPLPTVEGVLRLSQGRSRRAPAGATQPPSTTADRSTASSTWRPSSGWSPRALPGAGRHHSGGAGARRRALHRTRGR